MQRTYDTIVVGGGAIGATSAWRLAQSGQSVLLLERGRLGGEASGAAAGMLGAQLEVHAPGPFFDLCLESRRMYRQFAYELLEETGIDVQLVDNGILHVAHDEATAQRLQQRLQWQRQAGGSGEWWTAAQVAEREPLVGAVCGGLFLPEDGNLSAPLLARAVGVAAKRRATVVEGAQVIAIEAKEDRVRVATAEEDYHGQQVVIAAGAWAEPFLRQLGVPFPIRPVKGQLLAVRPRSGRLTRTIFSEEVYLVPKRDGSVVVGATEEHGAGFDRELTARGMATLLDGLAKVAPGLADAAFERAWTGLRPGSPHGQPLIGRVPGSPQVILAVGHFRNGVLLSPVTARIVEAVAWRRPLPERWLPFAPEVAVTNDHIERAQEVAR
jgi:glycine oxidase